MNHKNGLGNDRAFGAPPIYDLLPKVKGAVEKLQEVHEEKYPRPQ